MLHKNPLFVDKNSTIPTRPVNSDATKEIDVVRLLAHADDDPNSFQALMASWNAICEINHKHGDHTFAEVEGAAISALSSFNDGVSDSTVGRQVGQMLEKFAHPAFLVRENSQIVAQNSAAATQFDLNVQDTLEKLPYDLVADEPIADVVRASLDPRRNQHDAVLKQVFSTKNDGTATLSITPSRLIKGGTGEALVFVIDVRWDTEAAGLIKREFDLTGAERELLVSFLKGNSTLDIAKERGRSHATVRTQFHSLMTKMGASNQTELLRNALSVSQFVENISEIAKVLRHPYRKRVDIVRPGGRSVEVTMSGNLTGEPVIFLQCCVGYTFPPDAEMAFFNSDLCFLSICRPGYGETDPALSDQDYMKTFAADIQALLDQLGHKTCVILSTNTAPAVMYELATMIPTRISNLVQVSGCAPLHYLGKYETSAPWAQGVVRAANRHPAFKDFMLRAGLKAWRTIGQRSFLKSQLKKGSAEFESALLPDNVREFQKALDVATQQGLASVVRDMKSAFSDYRKRVAACEIPSLIIHGVQDSVFPIEALREFRDDFPKKTTLIEIPDAGFPLLFTHAPLVSEKILELPKKTSK